MEPNTMGAFEAFMQSGKVEDYLRYIDASRGARQIGGAAAAAGENSAYHDRRNRAAGTGGR